MTFKNLFSSVLALMSVLSISSLFATMDRLGAPGAYIA